MSIGVVSGLMRLGLNGRLFPKLFAVRAIITMNFECKATIVLGISYRSNHEHTILQTTGEPEPAPGIATFHLTFFVSLNSVGGVPLAAQYSSARASAPSSPPRLEI